MLYYVVSLLRYVCETFRSHLMQIRFSQIYVDGPILRAAQDARLYPDSKYFVDMPLKVDPGLLYCLCAIYLRVLFSVCPARLLRARREGQGRSRVAEVYRRSF